MTKGTLAFTLGGETRVLRAEEGVSVPAGVHHRVQVLEGPAEAIDGWSPAREDCRTIG